MPSLVNWRLLAKAASKLMFTVSALSIAGSGYFAIMQGLDLRMVMGFLVGAVMFVVADFLVAHSVDLAGSDVP